MDENFRKQMEENGADVETTLKRFMGKDTMYMKFIMKFLDDKNCEGVGESLGKQDYTAAFEYAHALKGVSGNLGLNPVHNLAAQISDLLRNKQAEEVEVEKVKELQGQLEESCNRFKKILEEYK